MQTRGAIVRQAPGKYEVVDLEVDDPRPGEIQVKLVASGLCHSDDHVATGDIPVGVYPFAGGHEGAGIVTQAAPNNKGIKEGDHVVFSFLPSCGHCRWCASGHAEPLRPRRRAARGLPVGGPDRLPAQARRRRTPRSARCAASRRSWRPPRSRPTPAVKVTTTSRWTRPACSAAASAPAGVRRSTPPQVQPGHTVIVMGIGGIGINAVQGASHAGASNIIAVDPVAFKREKAQELGATHAVETMEEATELAKRSPTARARTQPSSPSASSSPSTSGRRWPRSARRAPSWSRRSATSPTRPRCRSRWPTSRCSRSASRASLFGESNPNWDILRQLELYRSGVLKLDELITKTYTLDEIQQGYQDMHDGKNIRGVIKYAG